MQPPQQAGRPLVQTATPQSVGRSLEPGRALGLALGLRAEECCDLCYTRAASHRWVGLPPSAEYIERSRGINWLATVLVARWVAYQVPVSADEMLYISVRGDLAASLQQSVVNLTRAYLIWRDTVSEILQEEAARLGTERSVLVDALRVVRVSCDASLIQVARAFDRRMANLTDELRAEREGLQHLALHDALTGLPNRVLVYDRINQAVLAAKRHGTTFATLAIDLDGFKAVNDTLGHHCGDLVLQQIAMRLVHAVRESDTVGRWGGDEFTVLLIGLTHGAAMSVAAKLERRIAEALDVEGHRMTVGSTIGVAAFPDDGDDVQALLSAADSDMYRIKRVRRSRLPQ